MKKVLIVPDGHYFRDNNGDVYAENTHTYEFFSRYLMGFDKVYVLGRVSALIDENNLKLEKASGNGVEFVALPDRHGVKLIQCLPQILSITKKAIKKVDAVMLRVPSLTAFLVWGSCKRSGKPVGIEVVVDPELYFGKGTSSSFTDRMAEKMWTGQLKKMCLTANGVSYVTREYLQSKYPCRALIDKNNGNYFTDYYSSVCLTDKDFREQRNIDSKSRWTIVHVNNYISGYRKGHTVVLKLIKVLSEKGLDVRVRFIGDGDKVSEFKQQSRDLGIEDRVTWVGRLHGADELRKEYDNADFMVFPTMAEGLPRVLLEAMASGLVCLSSPVCGIPELLPAEMMCDYNDVSGYANIIMSLINSPDKMEQISAMNIEKAKAYKEVVLNERRKVFYQKLADLAK